MLQGAFYPRPPLFSSVFPHPCQKGGAAGPPVAFRQAAGFYPLGSDGFRSRKGGRAGGGAVCGGGGAGRKGRLLLPLPPPPPRHRPARCHMGGRRCGGTMTTTSAIIRGFSSSSRGCVLLLFKKKGEGTRWLIWGVLAPGGRGGRRESDGENALFLSRAGGRGGRRRTGPGG